MTCPNYFRRHTTYMTLSISYTVVCEKYGKGRSTVGDIQRNREKILKLRDDRNGDEQES